MFTKRRNFLKCGAGAALASSLPATSNILAADSPDMLIVDTHQHLWDLSWQTLPWLAGAADVLRRSYTTQDYLEEMRGLKVQSVYMEVDVTPRQHVAEAEHVIRLCQSSDHPTVAAVIGGRPDAAEFDDYLSKFRGRSEVKGVRQVLHGEGTTQGYCLGDTFVAGIRMLGEAGLSFDLCMRPGELDDGRKLSELCPETQFILDHCGNADINAFRQPRAADVQPAHEADAWRRAIERLAKRPNVSCKISGIIARAPSDWKVGDLAPIVNHCLDSFGPDRVIFGGDWPVCLLGARLRAWIDALAEIVKQRPLEEQQKLWHGNAQRICRLA